MFAAGADVSTVQLKVFVPTTAYTFVPRTVNVCAPSETADSVRGDVHASHASASRRHSKSTLWSAAQANAAKLLA
jgi:hypothetical protein